MRKLAGLVTANGLRMVVMLQVHVPRSHLLHQDPRPCIWQQLNALGSLHSAVRTGHYEVVTHCQLPKVCRAKGTRLTGCEPTVALHGTAWLLSGSMCSLRLDVVPLSRRR